jgi:glucose-6-phosphate isomerase
MHFTLEVMFTAALRGINAFDQPAIEAGKILALEYLAGK